jgi:LysM repeat protein
MESDQKNKRIQPRLVLLSLVLALALLVSALTLTPAAAANCKFKHTVEAGDTINYLANLYSVGWEQIVKANDLLPPYTITVGQVLCIPAGTEPSKTSTETPNKAKGKQPTLDVVPQISHVYVSVENFAPKTSYFVRIFPRNNTVSYRIGVFTTNKEGDFADWFKIPGFMPRTANMGVCVKNAWTDAVSCVKYEEPWVTAGVYLTRTCQKEGR